MPRLSLEHAREHGAQERERADEVDGDHLAERGAAQIREVPGGEDTGVVHEDVRDVPERFARARHGARDRAFVRDIARNRERAGSELGGTRREPVAAAREDRDAHARVGERARDRGSDPARRTGDERRASRERRAQRWTIPFPCASERNSSRVRGSLRKSPRTALVTVCEFCFCTPRIIMQR